MISASLSFISDTNEFQQIHFKADQAGDNYCFSVQLFIIFPLSTDSLSLHCLYLLSPSSLKITDRSSLHTYNCIQCI